MESKNPWYQNKYFWIGAFIVLIIIIWLLIPPPPIKATVWCPDITTYESREGIFNANNFSLGAVLLLDSESMQGRSIGYINYNNDSLIVSKPTNEVGHSASVDFKVTIESDIKASLEKEIKIGLSKLAVQKYKFSYYNFVRKDIPNPINLANSHLALIRNIENLHRYKPNIPITLCIISGLVFMDSLKIQINNKDTIKTEMQTKIGNVNVKYNYSCDSELFAAGTSNAFLWKATLMDYDTLASELVPYSGSKISIKEYDLVISLRP